MSLTPVGRELVATLNGSCQPDGVRENDDEGFVMAGDSKEARLFN
jgi:hypothetical protein